MATTALGLTLVAGMPAAVNANPDRDSRNTRSTNTSPEANVNESLFRFVKHSELIGTELMSNNGDEIGTMTDYIVDRGSGKIVFGIVQSGDFLGIGGKEVALSYNQLRFNAAGATFRTNMTKQELQRQTEFMPESWNDLDETSWMDNMGNWIDGGEDNRRAENTLRDRVRDGETRDIEGEVVRVTREDVMGEDYVCAVIRDSGDKEHKVLVGPSWFINSGDYSIHREDTAELRVVEHENGKWIAVGGEVGNRSVEYRDDEGNGRWNSDRSESPRYVLLSDLTGDSIEIAGSTVGEVQTTIVEGSSGQIAFIGLDPNENLFGMGDDISLVPWSSLSIIDQSTLSLDSNEAELSRAMVMPDNFDSMRTPGSIVSAYRVFDQEPPKFKHRSDAKKHGKNHGDWDHSDTRTNDRDRDARDQQGRTGDAWGHDSELIRALSEGKSMTITGTYQGMSTTRLVDGAPAATVITVKTDDGTRKVIIGPEWYTDRQDMRLDKGDKVTIKARRASFEGKEHFAAASVEHDGDRWNFWDEDKPMWSN